VVHIDVTADDKFVLLFPADRKQWAGSDLILAYGDGAVVLHGYGAAHPQIMDDLCQPFVPPAK
jgi:hypothetical protein